MIENSENAQGNEGPIEVPAGAVILPGNLHIPENAHGMVLMAHNSRSVENERYSDEFAPLFHASGLATLSVDLMKEIAFSDNNVSIFSQRIIGISNWLIVNPETQNYSIGYFGIGTVGAAALMAAAERPDIVHALVSCGGQIDAAKPYFPRVQAPTLFIAGEQDTQGINLYQEALAQIATPLAVDKKVETIAGVAQLLPDKLQDVMQLANEWFARHLVAIV